MPYRSTFIPSLLLGLLASFQADAQTFTDRVVSRLNSPVYVTAPNGDENRLFLLEQNTGRVRVIDLATEEVLDEPYLTISNLSRFGEKGLLGLAFHPDFATNGKLYVYASQQGGRGDHSSQVFEFTASDPLTSNAVDVSTQRSVLRFDQPFGNHNGGWIGFDPTATGEDRNYLYVATGDGGSGGDPQNNSQDTTENLLGKILRLDVSGDDFPDSDEQNYSIPASNPFVETTTDDEIFAYGLRNPWRTSFDRATGDLWMGDVGQGSREEIDLLPSGTSGQNYGWRVMEGTRCFNAGDARDGNVQCNDATLTEPVYEYRHTETEFGGRSVTGGYVYRGPVHEFQGQYFFADFASGHLWTLDPDSGDVLNRNDELDANVGTANASVASFGEDDAGDLYIVNYGGSLYRVSSTSRDATWDGSLASVGEAGDGSSWDDAKNWSREGVADVGFVTGDHLILDKPTTLQVANDETFSAVTLSGEGTLEISAAAEIVSGNIRVPAGNSPSIAVNDGGQLRGRSGTIRKLGAGTVSYESASRSPQMLAVHEGAVELNSNGFARIAVREGGVLDAHATTLDVTELSIDEGARALLSVSQDDSMLSEPHRVRDLSVDGTVEIEGPFDSDAFLSLTAPLTILQASSANLTGELEISDPDGTLGTLNMSGRTVQPTWSLTPNGTDLNVSIVRGIPGDTNLDGVVNFADFLVVSSNFNQPSENGWLDGDFSGAGVTSFSDFLALSDNFGRTGFRSANAAAVPEPSALVVLLIGLLTVNCFRLRRMNQMQRGCR